MEQSVTKRIAKNFTWLSIGDLLARGINFLAIIYMARVLGAAAFGVLNFAQAFLAYLLLFVDSGLSMLGTREIAKQREKAGSISLNIFAIRLLIALIVFVVSIVILLFIPLSLEMRLLFTFTFLFVFHRALNADWVYQGLERMEYISIARVAGSLLAFIATILIIKTSGDLIKVPLIQFVSGFLVSLFFLYWLFKKFTPYNLSHLNPTNWWDYFYEAMPLGASVILIQIYYNLDTIMLGFMDKQEVVGYYNAAYKIFFAVLAILSLWQSTAFPVVSKRMSEDREKAEKFLNKYLRLTMLVALPIVLLITFLSPWIIYLFYGSAYQSASTALQILIWSTILIVISGVYGILIMIPLGKSREFLYGVGSGALMNIILNIILIPRFSFIGAAVATLLSEAMVTVVMFYLIRKEIRINIFVNSWIPVFASVIASALFCIFFQYGSVWLKIISSSIIFSITYILIILMLGEKRFLEEFVLEITRK